MENDVEAWDLLAQYRLYDFEMDDGIELDRARILDEFRRETKPRLLELLTRHFASAPDAVWVLERFRQGTGTDAGLSGS